MKDLSKQLRKESLQLCKRQVIPLSRWATIPQCAARKCVPRPNCRLRHPIIAESVQFLAALFTGYCFRLKRVEVVETYGRNSSSETAAVLHQPLAFSTINFNLNIGRARKGLLRGFVGPVAMSSLGVYYDSAAFAPSVKLDAEFLLQISVLGVAGGVAFLRLLLSALRVLVKELTGAHLGRRSVAKTVCPLHLVQRILLTTMRNMFNLLFIHASLPASRLASPLGFVQALEEGEVSRLLYSVEYVRGITESLRPGLEGTAELNRLARALGRRSLRRVPLAKASAAMRGGGKAVYLSSTSNAAILLDHCRLRLTPLPSLPLGIVGSLSSLRRPPYVSQRRLGVLGGVRRRLGWRRLEGGCGGGDARAAVSAHQLQGLAWLLALPSLCAALLFVCEKAAQVLLRHHPQESGA